MRLVPMISSSVIRWNRNSFTLPIFNPSLSYPILSQLNSCRLYSHRPYQPNKKHRSSSSPSPNTPFLPRTPSIRSLRVSQVIQKALNEILMNSSDGQRSLSDPRLCRSMSGDGVTIVDVILSPDLRIAMCYWTYDTVNIVEDGSSTLPPPVPQIERALHGAAGMLRVMLSTKVSLKFIPELRFIEMQKQREEDIEFSFQ